MADLSNLHLHPAPALYFLGRTDMGVYKPRLQPHLSWWNLYHVYAYSLYCIIHHVNKVLFYSILFYSIVINTLTHIHRYKHTQTCIYSFDVTMMTTRHENVFCVTGVLRRETHESMVIWDTNALMWHRRNFHYTDAGIAPIPVQKPWRMVVNESHVPAR